MVNEKIRQLALRICNEQGFELYDIELKSTDKGRVLRIFITSPNGVTLDNCSKISRQLNNELDIIDFISSKYFLEVSSPGLERHLVKDTHYKQAIGETIKITYRKDKKTFTTQGTLVEVSPSGLTIEIDDKTELIREEYPFDSIKKVRTVFVMNQKSRR